MNRLQIEYLNVIIMAMVSVSLLNRAVSKGMDIVIALAIAEVLPRAGWVAAVLYVLVSDGVGGGQSIGKKLLGLRVLNSDGAPCGLKDSMLRNLLLGLGVFLWKIPLLGWPLLAAAIIVEFLVLMGSDSGKRLGDELADTHVEYESGHEDKNDDSPEGAETDAGASGEDNTEGENSSE